MSTRTQTIFAIAMSLVLLGSLAFATRVSSRASLEVVNTEPSRCVNRICPITGYKLPDQALAVEYRGEMVGVLNERAARAWGKLPETQQRDILVMITLPSHQ